MVSQALAGNERVTWERAAQLTAAAVREVLRGYVRAKEFTGILPGASAPKSSSRPLRLRNFACKIVTYDERFLVAPSGLQGASSRGL